MLSFDPAQVTLSLSKEVCADSDKILSVTLNGESLGTSEHKELFALRGDIRAFSKHFVTWEPQIAALGLTSEKNVVVLFEGAISQEPGESRKAPCMSRVLLEGHPPLWVITTRKASLVPAESGPKRISLHG